MMMKLVMAYDDNDDNRLLQQGSQVHKQCVIWHHAQLRSLEFNIQGKNNEKEKSKEGQEKPVSEHIIFFNSLFTIFKDSKLWT